MEDDKSQTGVKAINTVKGLGSREGKMSITQMSIHRCSCMACQLTPGDM